MIELDEIVNTITGESVIDRLYNEKNAEMKRLTAPYIPILQFLWWNMH